MANNISVEMTALADAQKICLRAIEELNKASQNLNRQYQQAGQGWKDSKYNELGGIVGECSQALTKPVGELKDCIQRLGDLQKAIEDYENVSL